VVSGYSSAIAPLENRNQRLLTLTQVRVMRTCVIVDYLINYQ
jgi:hypothetical protein